MDYRTGLPGPGPGAHEFRAPKPDPVREVAVIYLLFVVEKGVFCYFAVECTCAVLENVYVRCKSGEGTGEFSYCAVEKKCHYI